MTTPTPDDFDTATIALIFALRDSLTADGPGLLDFWDNRGKTAIEAAAAGSSTAAEAITAAARKLQIDVLGATASAAVTTSVAPVIDADYPGWANHIARTLTYIVAVARVENTERKTAKKPKPAPTMSLLTEEAPF